MAHDQAVDTAAARGGDEAAFARLVAPLRAQLHAHCYRMLGSVHDADDAVQDALLRAWRGLARFEGRSSLRSWLYTIATNTSLDVIERRGRRALPVDLGPAADRAMLDEPPLSDVAWLGPYPDQNLGSPSMSPEDRSELRESVELAFVAALQHLPGNQRAALLLFDVLGFSARAIAAAMDTTVASVNSALQRARRLVAEKRPARSQQQILRALGDLRVREVITRYTAALQNGDAEALVALLAEDASWAMPPLASWYRGHRAITEFLVRLPLRERWRHMPTTANGQLAVGCYRWDQQSGCYLAQVLDVLTLDAAADGAPRITEVTGFMDSGLFPYFGLQQTAPV